MRKGVKSGWLLFNGRADLALVAVTLYLAATVMAGFQLARWLPDNSWMAAILAPQHPNELFVHYSLLPRIAVSMLAGTCLGLSGAILQLVLRNPIAEPATLGISAGAQLSLTVVTLFAPSLLIIDQPWIALVGAGLTTAIVLAMAAPSSFSPLSVVMAGLIVSLICSAIGSILAVFHWQYLNGIFLWSSGSLVQNNWKAAGELAIGLSIGAVATALLTRPLTVMMLDDDAATGLGLPVWLVRSSALVAAVSLGALVVSAVGVIAFIGLAASNLAGLSGARRPRERLIWSPIIGAGLLFLADQSVQLLGLIMPEMPTGILTALLGAPLLLVLLPKLRESGPRTGKLGGQVNRAAYPTFTFAGMLLLLLLAVWFALYVGKGANGWALDGWSEIHGLLRWRWPRTAAALAAGCMLASAGTIMQRMTGNPMASPEILGISSGASLGVIVAFLLFQDTDGSIQLVAASGGAFLSLVILVSVGRKNSYSPQRLLMAGIAVGTIFTAIASFFIVSGDPRLGTLLNWMAGSTYRVTPAEAGLACVISIIGLICLPFAIRWLTVLPLGDATARSLGLNLRSSRFVLLLVAAILTASSTLIVGPLTFVGLMAPHMTRMTGIHKTADQLFISAILGAGIMVTADWLGRNFLFPYQIPAGLLASLIGGPYFLLQMRKGSR